MRQAISRDAHFPCRVGAVLFLCLCFSVWDAPSVRAQNRMRRVSGCVTDATSAEPLAGATVVAVTAQGGQSSTVTDAHGWYSVLVSAGSPAVLETHYVGYATARTTLSTLIRDTLLPIRLVPDAQVSSAVVSETRQAGFHSVYMGVVELPQNLLKGLPTPLGEADVLKIAQLSPGVQGGMEGTAGLYVRGGSGDETLYLLDGIHMYNVSHMLGMFSAFPPDAVKSVTLCKGVFPARYGGRVSGAVDVRTNDGDMQAVRGSVGVGLLTDRLHMEYPLVRDKLCLSLSGRVLHFLFAPLVRNFFPTDYSFYDVHGKLTYRLSPRDKLCLGAYFGDDYFRSKLDRHGTDNPEDWQEDRIKWGNRVVSGRWTHAAPSGIFSETLLSWSRWRFASKSHAWSSQDSEAYDEYISLLSSSIHDLNVEHRIQKNLSETHRLHAGIQMTGHLFSPSTDTFLDRVRDGVHTEFSHASTHRLTGFETVLWAEDGMSLFDSRLEVNAGLRSVLASASGRVLFRAEPRLSLRIPVCPGWAIKTAAGRMSQYVHLLTSSSLSMPSDMWVPVTRKVHPEDTWCASLGVYCDRLHGWEFSLEAYLKHSKHVVDYRDGVSYFQMEGSWEELLSMGRARAMGVELMVEKKLGKVTGMASYALSRSERIHPGGEVSAGQWFRHMYDRPHVFSVAVDWALNPRIRFTFAWSIESGHLITLSDRMTLLPMGVDSVQPAAYFPRRNNYRLPPSHRLNVGMALVQRMRHGHGEWQFSVYNVYNAKNPNFVNVFYQWKPGPNGIPSGVDISMQKTTILPILPSVSFTWHFGRP